MLLAPSFDLVQLHFSASHHRHPHSVFEPSSVSTISLSMAVYSVTMRMSPCLIRGIHSEQRGGDNGIDVVDRLRDSLSVVLGLDAVAQLEGFVNARGCSTGDG